MQGIECAVVRASLTASYTGVRRSLFSSDQERGRFLNRLVAGTRDVSVRLGLGCGQALAAITYTCGPELLTCKSDPYPVQRLVALECDAGDYQQHKQHSGCWLCVGTLCVEEAVGLWHLPFSLLA